MRDISVAAVAVLLVLGCQGDRSDSAEVVIDQAPAPALGLDCATLLTADDLQRICGAAAAWSKDSFETGKGPSSCSRRAGSGDRRVRFTVGVYPHLESARSVTRGVEPGAVKVESTRAGGASSTAAHMRRGNIAIVVTSTVAGGNDPLCDGDQLGKLALVIDSRLP